MVIDANRAVRERSPKKPVALFRKKSDGPGGPNTPPNGPAGAGDFQPDPEKARKWFAHARTSADSSNFGYALFCYASGISLDPESMSAHEDMWNVAIRYAQQGVNKKEVKADAKKLEGPTVVERFAAAEYAWLTDLNSTALALKAIEAAVKADQLEWGHWAAERVLNMLRKLKKLSKSPLLKAMELFREVGAWNEAMAAGELALQIDPSDNNLANELKDITAQRAMDQGGYAQAVGQGKGGFRSFIKDAEKQRELEELEAISGASSVEERNLLRAKKAYEDEPDSPDAINRYAQLVKKQDSDEALTEARGIYLKGFEQTGEYRFRMAAGDIDIELLRRKVKRAEERAEAHPHDDTLQVEVDRFRGQLLELRAREYEERVAKYPTDRQRKFELGEVLFDLERYGDAMEQFQKAKDEPKWRVRAGQLLGRCFAAEGWQAEAIQEFKEALEAIDAGHRELELAIQYDLMLSLIEAAREERAVDIAKEAKDICGRIARKDISYRDIRDKRREIDGLIREMDGAA